MPSIALDAFVGDPSSKCNCTDSAVPEPLCRFARARFGSAIIVVSLLLWVLTCPSGIRAQNVSIGTAAANNSALLHLESTTQGFLMPRVTDAQMQAITTPATSDFVFDNTYTNFYYYNGSIWTPLVGSGWSLTGDAGTSASTNFLGTKDAQDVVQKTNGYERMRFFNGGDIGLTNTQNVAGALRFYEASGLGSLFAGFKAGVQTSTIHYLLPPGDGSPNAALVDSLGTMSWHTFATIGGGGSVTLWNRGSGSDALEGDGIGNKSSGKYAISATEYCTASGQGSVAFGDSNRTSGKDGTISGGSNNTVSSQSGAVRGGRLNNSSGNNSYVGGGSSNSTSGTNATVLNGSSNSISGSEAVIINGANNSTAGQDNLIFGANLHPAGSNQLIFFPPTPPTVKMGIMTASPAEATDVVGNLRFSLAIKPNGSGGSSGQYLKSAGSGSPPTWGTIAIPSTNWGLTGTFGSNPVTNFIGTTDAQDFAIRTTATGRARIGSSGLLGINTTSTTHQVSSLYTGTVDESAAIYGVASGSTASQSVGIWGRADNTSTSNTGTVAVLATGNGNVTTGTTNVALQISQGEFAMGRTTEAPSAGTVTGSAAAGTLYSQQGPSGVIQLSLQTDLSSNPPTAGVFQDLGTVTINNRYITSSSIIQIGVVGKINGGGSPDPKNSIYKVNVESRTAGSCTVRIGMIPFVTDAGGYQGSDNIQVGYVVINAGR